MFPQVRSGTSTINSLVNRAALGCSRLQPAVCSTSLAGRVETEWESLLGITLVTRPALEERKDNSQEHRLLEYIEHHSLLSEYHPLLAVQLVNLCCHSQRGMGHKSITSCSLLLLEMLLIIHSQQHIGTCKEIKTP